MYAGSFVYHALANASDRQTLSIREILVAGVIRSRRVARYSLAVVRRPWYKGKTRSRPSRPKSLMSLRSILGVLLWCNAFLSCIRTMHSTRTLHNSDAPHWTPSNPSAKCPDDRHPIYGPRAPKIIILRLTGHVSLLVLPTIMIVLQPL